MPVGIKDVKEQQKLPELGIKDTLYDFVRPVREDKVTVLPNSWEPEDPSHDAFKIMIIESF